MAFNCGKFTRTTVLAVAIAFLAYNIYQTFVATLFISHFPLIIQRLPSVIQSSNPSLQLFLFLTQELAGAIGVYLRLIGAIFAINFAILFYRKNPSYLGKLSKALLLESLYFLLAIPVAINHLVGSTISTSAFLNFNTGLSYLFQVVVIFSSLFWLSGKLRNNSNIGSVFSGMLVGASMYFLGMWIRNCFLWVYGILPMQTQPTLVYIVGSLNSLITLLIPAVILLIARFSVKVNRAQIKVRFWSIGLATFFAGFYFVVYDLVSILSPLYSAYLLVIDGWMVTLCFLGVALFVESLRVRAEHAKRSASDASGY